MGTSEDHTDEEDDLESVKESLLRSPVRKRILRQLRETPGLNRNQLCEKLGLSENNLRFHMERLEDRGLIEILPSIRDKEQLCFLTEDKHLWDDEDTRILFGRCSTRHIAIYIAQNPAASTSSIADAIGRKNVTVRHHLCKLEDRDLIERVRVGRAVEYHPTEPLTDWTDELADAYDCPWQQAPDDAPGDEGPRP